MKFKHTFIYFFLLLMMGLPTQGWAQRSTSRQELAQKIEFYKENVRAIVLKSNHQVVNGRLSRFSKAGIVFNPSKSGPLYDPKPTFYPISQVEAFLDARGRVLWSRPGSTYERPRIRKGVPYSVRLGLQFGMGKHLNSYNSPYASQDDSNYLQDIKTGSQGSVDLQIYVQRNYALGLKYMMHVSPVSYYGLSRADTPGAGSTLGTINDEFDVNTVVLFLAFYQPVTANMLFHADVGAGQSRYKNPGRFLTEPRELTATAFSGYLGTGFDYSLTRNISLGFEVSLLLGTVNEPIDEGAESVEFQQNLNRLDVNGGLRIFF